jgi:hypothetical protein
MVRKTKVTYRISPELIEKNIGVNRATPLLQPLWTQIVGTLPPINNIARLAAAQPTPTLTTLQNSVAYQLKA